MKRRTPEADGDDEQGFRVIAHQKHQPCPRCKRPSYCDGCGLCEDDACGFAAPLVECVECHERYDHAITCSRRALCVEIICDECGDGCAHERTCAVTLRAAAN